MVSILHNNYPAIALAWSFSLTGIMSNICVLVTLTGTIVKSRTRMKAELFRYRRQNSSKTRIFQILIVNLAIADTFGSLYLLVIATADLYYRFVDVGVTTNDTGLNLNSTMIYASWIRHPFCYMGRSLFILSYCSSILITLVIAVDRYIRVFHPFSNIFISSTKAVILMTSLIWIYSSLIAIVCNYIAYATILAPNLPITYQYHNICFINYLRSWIARLFLFMISMTSGVIYSLVMCLYIMMLYKLRSIRKNRIFIADRNSWYHPIEKKTLFMVHFMALTNFLVMLPSLGFGITTFANFQVLMKSDSPLIGYSVILIIFLQCNCCINPILFLSSTRQKHIHNLIYYRKK